MTPTALTRWALVGLGAAALTASAGIADSAVKAPAAPVLSAKPPVATSSTSATLAWTGPAGASFQCALDGAGLTACTSPRTYTGLTAARHAFRVRSVVGGATSAETTHAWTVDTTPPPAPALTTRPAATATSTTASFAFSDAEAGVSYQCRLDGAASFTPCSNPVTFTGLAQGAHALSVRAVDAAGNAGAAAPTHSWRIDSVAPPAPVLTQKPADPATGATHAFAWTDSEAGVTFECALESSTTWKPCTSPYSFVVSTTSSGQHQLAVRAVDAAGNRSTATRHTWKVVKDGSTSGMPFQVSGTPVSGLTPGTWHDVPVTVTNPNAVPVYVTALTLVPPPDGSVPGCPSSVNLRLEQSDASGTHPLLVPAGGSVTLPSGGVSAPRIQIVNLATVNQDGCKGKSFPLAATGTAHN